MQNGSIVMPCWTYNRNQIIETPHRVGLIVSDLIENCMILVEKLSRTEQVWDINSNYEITDVVEVLWDDGTIGIWPVCNLFEVEK